MTVEEMIGKADVLLVEGCGEADAVIAQAWLMRADLALRLRERRSAFAADAVKKLDESFKIFSAYSTPEVVPLEAGDGFLIRLSNYNARSRSEGEHPWGEVINWVVIVTNTYAEAGWKIELKLEDIKACPTAKQHEFWYMVEDKKECWKQVKKPMPYCCKCGAPRSLA